MIVYTEYLLLKEVLRIILHHIPGPIFDYRRSPPAAVLLYSSKSPYLYAAEEGFDFDVVVFIVISQTRGGVFSHSR